MKKERFHLRISANRLICKLGGDGMNMNDCSPEYKKYLCSPEWMQIRERILCRDAFQCRMCGEKDNLHVHHIHGRYRFHEENHPECLMVLCDRCHRFIHRYWNVCDSIKEYYDNQRHQEQMRKGYY